MLEDSENATEVSTINPKVLKSRNDKLKSKLDIFDQNPDDYDLTEKSFESVTEKTIPISKDPSDKLLSINNIIETAVLTISGYEKEVFKDKLVFKQKKLPLTKNNVITTFHAILEPYGDVSNILAKKDWESFSILIESSWRAFYKFCIHSRAKPKQNTRTIYREFQSCMINIGEIVCENPKNMEGFFNNLKSEYPDSDIAGRM
jgi:hypothetical protein